MSDAVFDTMPSQSEAPIEQPSGWTLKSRLVALGIFIVLYVITSMIQVYMLGEANGGMDAFNAMDAADRKFPFSITVVSLIGFSLSAFVSIFGVGILGRKLTFADLGFRKTRLLWLLIAAGIAIPLSILRILVVAGLYMIFPSIAEGTEAVTAMLSNAVDPITAIISILLISFLVPVYEELLFRGFLYGWARKGMAFLPAALLTSVLFGVYHFNLAQGISVIFLGLALAWLTEKANSLWPAIVLHIITNLFGQLLVYGFMMLLN